MRRRVSRRIGWNLRGGAPCELYPVMIDFAGRLIASISLALTRVRVAQSSLKAAGVLRFRHGVVVAEAQVKLPPVVICTDGAAGEAREATRKRRAGRENTTLPPRTRVGAHLPAVSARMSRL